MFQKLLLPAALGLSTLQIVAAQDDTYIPPKLRVSMDQSCGEGPLLATDPLCAWNGDSRCFSYDREDLPGFPLTSDGDITGYISGADVYTQGCKLLIFETVTENPTCGLMVAEIDQLTPCRQFNFPANFGLGCGCGASCDVIAPGKRSLEYPMSSALDAPEKRGESIDTPSARSHARDVQLRSAVPRSPLHKRDCSFNPSSGPTDVNGDAQTISANLDCPSNENSNGCSITRSYSLSISQTNTFGVSTEIGASSFEIIQASISFSYEYSYTEEQTTETSYTVNLAPGQSGYLTFIPLLECTWGTFDGDCDADTGEQGRACIPKFQNNNPNCEPDGSFRFVEELRGPGP